jgi:hypothetical protein
MQVNGNALKYLEMDANSAGGGTGAYPCKYSDTLPPTDSLNMKIVDRRATIELHFNIGENSH